MSNVFSAFRLSLCLVVVACAGCRSLRTVISQAPELPEVSPQRAVRRSEVAASFDRQRNEIQIAVARARWQEGDLEACVMALDDILSRQSDHPEANQLLTDVEKAAGIAAPHLAESPSGATNSEAPSVPSSSLAFVARKPLFDPPGSPPASKSMPDDRATGPVPHFPNHPAGQVAQASSNIPQRFNSLQPSAPIPPKPSLRGQAIARPAGKLSLSDAGRALSRGDVGPVHQILQMAMAAEPANHDLAVSAAALPLRYNQPDLSVVLASQALRRFNGSAELHRIAGTAHYRRGDYQSSEVALRQALSLDNGHPLTYFLLGLALHKAGKHEAAEWHIRQARQRDTKSALRR